MLKKGRGVILEAKKGKSPFFFAFLTFSIALFSLFFFPPRLFFFFGVESTDKVKSEKKEEKSQWLRSFS